MTHTTATNTYHVFMLPDLEAYVHGLKFKNKLKRWGKSQGFKELSPDNLKEWCTDSFVLDSLLKVNNYKTSPLNSPISPMTPEFPHALWQVPPCRGNLLDECKLSGPSSCRCPHHQHHHSSTGTLGTLGTVGSQSSQGSQAPQRHKSAKIKRFWHKMTGQKNGETHCPISHSLSLARSGDQRSLRLSSTKVLQTTSTKTLPYPSTFQGSTNVLRLLELI
ncbi:hypothetical protein FIM1_5051 [Kluyveromyces marxianus]|uniref:Uncharacterized protein n=2 Tax=Kluyveromyces marxianus TaxID=4911 RepID=W0TG10_KLUMD|nr:hypothetical protein KLMA_80266 [Kluyveromyces marxianus DMKU3-1042]QGN17842.1 hypothetical protein FIM1_5051 [Kluyveromyces marxianus]BAO42577.1 hypothetical protein KLMA_80266 [Kluyveromyces marxianus DMKU3-1042]